MKSFVRNNLFGFLIGIILCSGVIYGVNLYRSEDIQYQPSDESWNVSNVNEAINSLYKTSKEINEEYLKAINTGHIVAVYIGCYNPTSWTTNVPLYVDSQLGTYSDGVYTLKYDGTYRMYSYGTSTDYSNHSGNGNTGGGRFLVNDIAMMTNTFSNVGTISQDYKLSAGDKIIWQQYGAGYCAHVAGILYKVD